MKRPCPSPSTLALAVAAVFASATAYGQIATDGTLGAAQVLAGPNFAIPAGLGQQAGANLFHSFAQFGVPTGGSAIFSGPNGISNVISRVTGVDASIIDGRLGSSIAGANLFLVNPRGMLFGPNASLDLTGSFYASTAHYLRMADGTRFDASATVPAVLSMAPPAAFGFLGPTGPIIVQGSSLAPPAGGGLTLVGGGIAVSGAFLLTSAADLRLEAIGSGEAAVAAAAAPTVGTTFGNVSIDASQVFAANVGPFAPGRLVIRGGQLAIADSVVQSINGGATDASRLELAAGGDLGVSGSIVYAYTEGPARGADLVLSGENVTIDRASDVGAFSTAIAGPTSRAGDLDVNARGAVRIVSAPGDAGFARLLNIAFGAGSGGTTRVSGDTVLIEASSIENYTQGSGDAGPIVLAGRAVEILNGSFLGAYSATGATGRGAGIDISATERVRIAGADWTGFRTSLLTATSGAHDAGAVRIAAPEIAVANAAIQSLSDSSATGASGGITLSGSRRVDVSDGAYIFAATTNSTRGGDLRIEAGDLAVTGLSYIASQSLGASRAGDVALVVVGDAFIDGSIVQSLASASGDAGRVSVSAHTLAITNTGAVDSSTAGDGAGGDVDVRAARITIDSGGGVAANSGVQLPGGIQVGRGAGGRVTVEATEALTIGTFAAIAAGTFGAGNGGNIEVRTPRLTIFDGAQLAANTGGSGRAGNIMVDVGDLEVRNFGAITSGNGLLSGVIGTGDGGEIRIRASGRALVTAGAYVETSTRSSGRGGQITIDAGELTISDRGLVNANTDGTGEAGAVTVRAGAITISDDTSGIYATTFGPGQGGRIQVTTPRLLITNDGQIGANTGGSGHAGSIFVDVGELELRTRGAVTSTNQLLTGVIGSGNGGDIQVRASGNVLLADGAFFSTNTFSAGRGGRVTVDGHELTFLGGSGITALTAGTGEGGAVTVRGDALRLAGQSGIVAGTFSIGTPGSGDGNAGSVSVEVGRLEVVGGSQITSSSGTGAATGLGAGGGAAGNVDVLARESVVLSGESDFGPSGLYSQTHGPGAGGRIVATTPLLAMDSGAVIDTSTGGAGDAGAIDLQVGSAVLRGAGTSINSGNLLFFRGVSAVGTGAGGLVRLAAAGSVILEDGAVISTRTGSDAPAGNISIGAAAVELQGGSLITSQSFAGGNAGSVSIDAGQVLRIFGASSITTAAVLSDGGNIDIRASDLVHLRDSEITTSVGSGQGAGGNITIDPTFVVLENSRIVANAFGGPGGNIRIVAQYFLSSLPLAQSVEASSQRGVQGSVQIAALNTNLSNELAALPVQVLDSSALLRDACTTRVATGGGGASSLVGVGRGGLAASPERFAPSSYFARESAGAPSAESAPTGLKLHATQRARLIVGCPA